MCVLERSHSVCVLKVWQNLNISKHYQARHMMPLLSDLFTASIHVFPTFQCSKCLLRFVCQKRTANRWKCVHCVRSEKGKSFRFHLAHARNIGLHFPTATASGFLSKVKFIYRTLEELKVDSTMRILKLGKWINWTICRRWIRKNLIKSKIDDRAGFLPSVLHSTLWHNLTTTTRMKKNFHSRTSKKWKLVMCTPSEIKKAA